jgi:hypothetical protein
MSLVPLTKPGGVVRASCANDTGLGFLGDMVLWAATFRLLGEAGVEDGFDGRRGMPPVGSCEGVLEPLVLTCCLRNSSSSHFATNCMEAGSDDANNVERLDTSALEGFDTGKAFDTNDNQSCEDGEEEGTAEMDVEDNGVAMEWIMPSTPERAVHAAASPVNDCSTSCFHPCDKNELLGVDDGEGTTEGGPRPGGKDAGDAVPEAER